MSRRLGLMLASELRPDQLIDLVQLSEACGYHEFWYTDARFWRDCYAGLTLAAQATQRLLLGPGVNDPFTRHPATIAMSIATLDELSGGRAQLGLGVGGSGISEMRLRHPRPVRALREAIDLIRALLTGEPVQFEGEVFHLDGGRLGFQPLRHAIPTYVASHSPQVLRLCGRTADGVLLGNMARRAAVEDATGSIREGEQAAGRTTGSTVIDLRLEACVSENREAALRAMKRRFAVRLVSTYPQWGYLDRLGIEATPAMRASAEAGNLDGMATVLSDAAVRSTALVGSAAEVAEQLQSLLTDDIRRVTIRPYACEGQGLDATIRAFSERVWPMIT